MILALAGISSWWRHQVETFSALLALCAGNSPVTGDFPHKGQWRGALIFSLVCAWINVWVNNRDAGDLRRHHAHYDVTVMLSNHLNDNMQIFSQTLVFFVPLWLSDCSVNTAKIYMNTYGKQCGMCCEYQL